MRKTRWIGIAAGAFLLAVGLTSAGRAQLGASVGQGRTRLSVSGGYASLNNRDYGVLGLGAGYYFKEGFEAGLDGEAWIGSKPHIYALSPEARYIIPWFESYKPYVGGFYKRTFYDTAPTVDSAGGRAGLVTSLSEHTYLTAGVVYERVFNCDKSIYTDCSLVYPEIGFSFSY